MMIGFARFLCIFFCFLPGLSWAEQISLTDIDGRRVRIEAPVQRIILGEGRLIYVLAVLNRDNPFQHIVGWRKELQETDPEIYAAYHAQYPEIADITDIGYLDNGTFSLEQIVALKPDVVLMELDFKPEVAENQIIERLDAVGIPLVFVDFRHKMMENTEKSVRIMAQLFGKEQVAEEFLAFRRESLERVAMKLEQANPSRPVVFIERGANSDNECCPSFGEGNFGEIIERAGGINMAKSLIPGVFGTVHPEQVIASDPDHIIATGSTWEIPLPGGGWVGLGHGADEVEAQAKLEKLMQRPAFTELQAVKHKNVHAAWHQFYAGPFKFIAVEKIAKWLHPQIFADLDPEHTFSQLHERFLPLPYKSGYFVSLKEQ